MVLISFSKTTKFFLSSSIPNVELNWTVVGIKDYRVNIYTLSCNILLFKFTSKMSFNKSSFSNTSITNQNKLEFGSWFHIFNLINFILSQLILRDSLLLVLKKVRELLFYCTFCIFTGNLRFLLFKLYNNFFYTL